MLLYGYFAKRGTRKEKEYEAQHNASSYHRAPEHLISQHSNGSGEKSQKSPLDEQHKAGHSLSPKQTGSASGLAPNDSHAGSATSTQHHDEHSDVEKRAKHKYTIRRPRALQYSYKRRIITTGENEAGILSPAGSHGEHDHAEKSDISSHLPEAVAKQRERLDLFIDLIWVGIISNLSEVFSALIFSPTNTQPGLATMVFILVFLPSWRIWNTMRAFLNNYYMDDMIQRLFTFWILVLSVFFGNQLAYLAEDIDGIKVWCITTYLIIQSSFLLIEEIYSIFIPWLRKLVIFQLLIRIPAVGLWIAGIYLNGAKAIGPVLAATMWEYFCPFILDSALADRFTPGDYKKALDVNHFSARMANFFIIVLGEGVLQLVKDGPMGRRLNGGTGTIVWVLLIYFNLSYLYFVRDGSKTYLPAVRHKNWRALAFVFWHIPLFSSLLTFVASVMFILRHQNEQNYTQQEDEAALTPEQVSHYIENAVWTCALSLAIIVLSTLGLGLLDQPLDRPRTLRIDNRYLRMAGRPLYIILITLLPIKSHIDPAVFLTIAAVGLVVLSIWEWNACLERGGGFIEPKGLTVMMSHELKGKRQVVVAHGEAEDGRHLKKKFEFMGPLARI